MADNKITFDLELVTKAFEDAIRRTQTTVDKLGDGVEETGKGATKEFQNLGKEGRKAGEEVSKGAGSAVTAWEVFKGSLAAQVFVGAFNKIMSAAGSLYSTFVTDGIRAAQVQEDAINKLAASLRTTGELSDEVMENFQEFASSLQENSTVGDEATLAHLALAKSLGLSNEQAKQAVQTATDLSAGMGIELKTAVEQVSQSFTGQVGRLGKLNPEIRNLTEAQLRAGEAARILGEQFAGQAAAKTMTFSGALTQAQNAFGDLQEEIGFLIIKNPAFVQGIRMATTAFNDAIGYIQANSDKYKELISGGINVLISAFNKLVEVGRTVGKFLIDNIDLVKAVGVGVGAMAAAYGVYVTSLGTAAAAQAVLTAATVAFNTALNMSPIGIATVAIGLLSAGIYALYQNWDLVTGKMAEFAASAIDSISPAITTILDTIRPLVAIFSDDLALSIDAAKEQLAITSEELLAFKAEKDAQLLLAHEQKYAKEAALDTKAKDEQKKRDAEATNARLAELDREKLAKRMAAEEEIELERQKQEELTELILQDREKHLETARYYQQKRIEADEAEFKRRMDLEAAQSNNLFQELAQRQKYEEITSAQRAQNFRSTLNTMSGLQNSANRELFEVGKAAAIAQATINTYQAATIALASSPPPVSYVLAAAVVAAGLMNVAKIASQSPPKPVGRFAQGGIVPGTSYTGDNLTAQVNSSEMILNRRQQARLFHMANGGDVGGGLMGQIVQELRVLREAVFGQPIVLEIDGQAVAKALRGQSQGGFSFI